MRARFLSFWILLCAFTLASVGCGRLTSRLAYASEVGRPDQLLDFAPLYQQNCSGCHGANGQNGAAISLANPVYLAIAESNLTKIIAGGVPGTLMPPFAKSAGGMLTDSQIAALAQGMLRLWSRPELLAGQTPPPYASRSAGDPVHGQAAFATFCARCHGAGGAGTTATHLGSLVDPSYLALVSEQSLRAIIIAGQPKEGMPDWRSDLAGAVSRPLSDGEITDIVAWLATHRSSMPGQQYTQAENNK